MQIFIYAMPIMALYAVLTSHARGETTAALAVLFSFVLLCGLIIAFSKWYREKTAQWRNIVVTCALVGCFMGCRYIPDAARLVIAETSTMRYSRSDIAAAKDDIKYRRVHGNNVRHTF